jgi:4-hydroxy-3-polyprenylbenzoate decarboxylase
MPKKNYRNLTDFIQVLEAEGELVRIKAPVSSFLEITEITDRVSKSPSGGKALLFEQVDGSSFPVITNAFGSEKRISLALGVRKLDELGRRVTSPFCLYFPRQKAMSYQKNMPFNET